MRGWYSVLTGLPSSGLRTEHAAMREALETATPEQLKAWLARCVEESESRCRDLGVTRYETVEYRE